MLNNCEQCGECCEKIYLPFLASEDEKRWIGYHGIEYIENEMGTFIKVNSKCSKLKDGKCSIHDIRPGVCRKWFCQDNKDFK